MHSQIWIFLENVCFKIHDNTTYWFTFESFGTNLANQDRWHCSHFLFKDVYIASNCIFMSIWYACFVVSGSIDRNLTVFLLTVYQWILFFGSEIKTIFIVVSQFLLLIQNWASWSFHEKKYQILRFLVGILKALRTLKRILWDNQLSEQVSLNVKITCKRLQTNGGGPSCIVLQTCLSLPD